MCIPVIHCHILLHNHLWFIKPKLICFIVILTFIEEQETLIYFKVWRRSFKCCLVNVDAEENVDVRVFGKFGSLRLEVFCCLLAAGADQDTVDNESFVFRFLLF
jgi:hypothetical protein